MACSVGDILHLLSRIDRMYYYGIKTDKNVSKFDQIETQR